VNNNRISEDFYWVVAVNTLSGSSVTIDGTPDADAAAAIAKVHDSKPHTRAFVAGRR
jgi:hypothetical protein